jgi:hypothetical protein
VKAPVEIILTPQVCGVKLVITDRLRPAETGVARLIIPATTGVPAVIVANTVAKPLDKARPVRTAVEFPSSARTATDGPGRCPHSYGSDAPEASPYPLRAQAAGQHRELTVIPGQPSSWLTCGQAG